MFPYGLSSFNGAGFAVTPNLNSCGSSQTSIGSTNGPVEKTQCRTAPTPCPEISARIGYAIPARNNNSFGGGISANATTWFQTFSGGAFTSIAVRTSNVSGCSFAQCSTLWNAGVNRKTIDNMAGVPLCSQYPAWIAYPSMPPSAASASANGAAIKMQITPSIITRRSTAPSNAMGISATAMQLEYVRGTW